MAIKLDQDWVSEENNENRGERRRALYLGEKVTCVITHNRKEFTAEVVDISPQGLAFISNQKDSSFQFCKGDELKLSFIKLNPPWDLKATVANISTMKIQKQTRQRIGVQFELAVFDGYNQFTHAIGTDLIPCKTYIRPQISCADPFFYKEIILFQCNGFTAKGIDLVCSSRWKSILPGQNMDLTAYIPGRGEFKILVKNSNNFYQSQWKDRFRIYLEYLEVSEEYEHAVCEYLVMMQQEVTPHLLRKYNFRFHNFDKACYLEKANYYLRSYPPQEFLPSVFAKPESELPDVRSVRNISRELCCKLGANRVAYFNLVFFDSLGSSEKPHRLQEALRDDVLRHSHIIMTNLIVSKKVILSDILVPMLQQVIRIAAQSRSKYLILNTDKELVQIFKKIGFKQLANALNINEKIMVLEVNGALANHQLLIETHVWNKVYKDLNIFLGRHHPRTKQKYVLDYSFSQKDK